MVNGVKFWVDLCFSATVVEEGRFLGRRTLTRGQGGARGLVAWAAGENDLCERLAGTDHPAPA